MTESILQIGAVGVLFLVAIREFFSYLKSKKSNGNDILNEAILKQLQLMNSNHLHSIQDAIEKGNERLIDAIHSDNIKMIEALGEIKGKLSK